MGTSATVRRWRDGARALALLGVLLGAAAPAGGQGPAPTTSAASARPAAAPRPSPALTPHEVVTIVLEALRNNDLPTKDRGIAVTFDFASPANREATGPIERFASLVKNPFYRPMINHQRAERGEMIILGSEARQRVTLVVAGGERVTYTFILTRQGEGQYRGCWMTDGVVRETELRPERFERLTN